MKAPGIRYTESRIMDESTTSKALVHNDVPQLPEGLHGVAPGDDRETAHPGISTTSSSMLGGMGSPWARRLSR